MAVYKGSRYENVKATSLEYPDGSQKVFLHPRQFLSPDSLGEDFFLHEVKLREELDGIVDSYGFPSIKWWIVADVNEIFFPFDIQYGMTLKIPGKRFFD